MDTDGTFSVIGILRAATEEDLHPIIYKELCWAIEHLLCREMFVDQDDAFIACLSARIFMYACLIDRPMWVATMLVYGWDFEQLLPAAEESQWKGDLREVPVAFAAYKNLNICRMLLDAGARPGINPLLIHHVQFGRQPTLYTAYTIIYNEYSWKKFSQAQYEEWLFLAIGAQEDAAVAAIADIAGIDVNAPYQTSGTTPVEQALYMLGAAQDVAAKAKAQDVMAALASVGGEFI